MVPHWPGRIWFPLIGRLQDRAPSTRRLYTNRWKLFSDWCRDQQGDPVCCSVTVLCFLQILLDRGISVPTVKVCVAAISARHVLIDDGTFGSHPLVGNFLKWAHWLHPPPLGIYLRPCRHCAHHHLSHWRRLILDSYLGNLPFFLLSLLQRGLLNSVLCLWPWNVCFGILMGLVLHCGITHLFFLISGSQDFFKAHKLNILQWPVQSPALIWIEQLCSYWRKNTEGR